MNWLREKYFPPPAFPAVLQEDWMNCSDLPQLFKLSDWENEEVSSLDFLHGNKKLYQYHPQDSSSWSDDKLTVSALITVQEESLFSASQVSLQQSLMLVQTIEKCCLLKFLWGPISDGSGFLLAMSWKEYKTNFKESFFHWFLHAVSFYSDIPHGFLFLGHKMMGKCAECVYAMQVNSVSCKVTRTVHWCFIRFWLVLLLTVFKKEGVQWNKVYTEASTCISTAWVRKGYTVSSREKKCRLKKSRERSKR